MRATALPPDERRAAIVSATIPLLITHGPAVTTRQIAEAAGIAEGTIFRVFADKDALLEAAIDTAFDPAPLVAALGTIDLGLPLAARLETAAEMLQRRVTDIWQLMSATGQVKPPHAGHAKTGRPDLTALAALFAPDAERLTRPPLEAAHLLRGLVFAGTHPALIIDDPLTPHDIVSVLLDGLRARPSDIENR